MARKERKYRRLPGRPFSLFDIRSLWQGPDHLLWVESVFFSEHYKRFFFKDIQSVVIQRNGRHWLWTAVWGGLALTCGLPAVLLSGTHSVIAVFALLFLLALLVNLALGPGCSVYLQTAVQVQKLTNLNRVRTARKAIGRIKPLIEAVQGSLKQPQAFVAQAAVQASAPAETAAETSPSESYKPLLHRLLFALLVSLGSLGCLQLLVKNLAVAMVEILLHAAVQILVIAALTRWYRQIKGSMVSKINWMALCFIFFQTLVGYGLFLAVSFRNPMINYHHWEMFKLMFQLQTADHPLALTGNLIYAGGCLVLGLFGLLVMRRGRARARAEDCLDRAGQG
jgi:hypothetical protein